MAIWNFGSINIDHVYRVATLPRPGETVAATDHARGLGGKGANQSIAAARMGAKVEHVGAVGSDGDWAVDRLSALGVGTGRIARVAGPTGHAIITVETSGENVIVVHAGANHALTADMLRPALSGAAAADVLLLQNETAAQAEVASLAAGASLRVVYSAAPFAPSAVREVLPHLWMLVVNAGEAEALERSFGCPVTAMGVPVVVVTRGADGASWLEQGQPPLHVPAHRVTPVDTTGAGDCFLGALVASLDLGFSVATAMARAAAAAALQVTRAGAAEAMPTAAETDALLRRPL